MNNILRLKSEGYQDFSATSIRSIITRIGTLWDSNPQMTLEVIQLPNRETEALEMEARAMFVTMCLATKSEIDVSQYSDQIPCEVVKSMATLLKVKQ